MRRVLSFFPSFSPRISELSHCVFLLTALTTLPCLAQFESYGLAGRTVYSLATFGGKIYAGTDSGIYMQLIGQNTRDWSLLGLKGKRVRSVYPHTFGPLGYAVTVGIEHTPGDPDSTLIYCSRYSDTSWVRADSGISHAELTAISSIDGFPSPAICGETFAAGGGTVYRGLSGVWERVLDVGLGSINVVKANSTTISVVAAGSTAGYAPLICLSRDKGTSWDTTYSPGICCDRCRSLTFDPADTSVMYATLGSTILKSKDGGRTWVSTSFGGFGIDLHALVFDPFTRTIFAAGAGDVGDLIVYKSTDNGTNWIPLLPTVLSSSALCMIIIPTMIPESNRVLIGTSTTGVVAYTIPFTSVPHNTIAQVHRLESIFPNPFNPSTTIRFIVGGIRHVAVKLHVYDELGRPVRTLVSGMLEPGVHEATWDGMNDAGIPVSSGAYVSRIFIDGNIYSRPMLLLK